VQAFTLARDTKPIFSGDVKKKEVRLSGDALTGTVTVTLDTGDDETKSVSLREAGLLVNCDAGIGSTCALIDWRFALGLAGQRRTMVFYVSVKRKSKKGRLLQATVELYGGTTVALRGTEVVSKSDSVRMLVGIGKVDKRMEALAKEKPDLLILAGEGYRLFFPLYDMCSMLAERLST
jgi:hypothetical protein